MSISRAKGLILASADSKAYWLPEDSEASNLSKLLDQLRNAYKILKE